jgi:N-acetylmuramoyl-L-alanine amidase
MKHTFRIITKQKPSRFRRMPRIALLAVSIVFCIANIGQYVSAAADYDFYNSNNILYYDQDACDPSATASTDSTAGLSGGPVELEIWNWLTDPAGGGLSGMQAAGIMGNMSAESSFNPDAHEVGGTGYGLVQWSFGRADALRAAAKKQGVAASDLLFQLKYLKNESESRAVTSSVVPAAGSEWATLKTITTVENATLFWHNNFEVSSDTLAAIMANRVTPALNIYNKYKGASGSASQTTASAATGPNAKPVIFLDPGHGGSIPDYTDAATGLVTNETNNTPETADVLDVANLVKTALEKPDASGNSYDVQMARTDNTTKIKFRDRDELAAKDNAVIGISIHTSPGASDNSAWPQHDGFRQYGSHKDDFGDTSDEKATMALSQKYADAFVTAREADFKKAYPNLSDAELATHNVSTDMEKSRIPYPQETASFGRGANIKSTGNIPFVALWSPKVPWVYNEITQDGPGASITAKTKQAYANGIIDAVRNSIPTTPVAANQCGGGSSDFAGGNFAQTLAAYAWPNYRGHPYLIKTPAYAKAVIAAQASGRYVGGLGNPGIDCGGFITTLMIDSGFEPNYNYGGKPSNGGGTTVQQQTWLKAHWRTVGPSGGMDPSKLHPGDVAINGDHTFVYAGKVGGTGADAAPPGFTSNTASASVAITTTTAWRAPMAGDETPNMPGYTWYSKYPN